MQGDALARLLESVARGEPAPVYLVTGEAVLSEPAATRLAEGLAAHAGCEVAVVRRPSNLGSVLDDLRTYSLFSSAKVVLAVETAVLADRTAAAELIDEAAEVLPAGGAAELTARERRGASCLLQVLHLFGIEPTRAGSPLSELPDWVFQGGAAFRRRRRNRARGKKQAEELRLALGELLEPAMAAGLVGWAEGGVAELAAVQEGLPPGHSLVLAESRAAKDHPLVERLAAAGCHLALGHVEAERGGGWGGLGRLAAELRRQTGSRIEPEALEELARRTLRKAGGRGVREQVDPNSTARLAAEYRKLATLAGVDEITLALVRDAVEDRGEEDVWQLLDAVGAGEAEVALARLRRLLYSAEDAEAARLSCFSLLADFCRQLVAVAALMRLQGIAAGERNYGRFRDRLAPPLQVALDEGDNPLAGLHPFRLHRVYLAASRLRKVDLARLPARVLEAELRLKGESGDPDVALSELVVAVASGSL